MRRIKERKVKKRSRKHLLPIPALIGVEKNGQWRYVTKPYLLRNGHVGPAMGKAKKSVWERRGWRGSSRGSVSAGQGLRLPHRNPLAAKKAPNLAPSALWRVGRPTPRRRFGFTSSH